MRFLLLLLLTSTNQFSGVISVIDNTPRIAENGGNDIQVDIRGAVTSKSVTMKNSSIETSSIRCAPQEELQLYVPHCEPTCSKSCVQSARRSKLVHKPTCVCKAGYVRHKKRCIKLSQCPTCGPYAKYSSCTPCCESTCTLDCSEVLCLSPCAGKPTCLCQPGYVKHKGACIKKEMCPSR
ncbi:keratin-associated protein 5-4-like isoform X2 [Toxorhynchites rutilus septentrionalis]|uniref:keratin-associated protein 5-4-like isoform X2 n=1 Tax=Toxorhynchites rutilus septentrionalis TaxID=329112 RepID=UPI002479A513|nr:keratin-associated protein 5-4-like isoform X2 [Toxorhynchites rutilus septentrionalis]